MRPNIGIFGDVNAEQDVTTQRVYTKAIELSGGVPILLPYVENGEVIEQFAELCDGFLFTGGADIEPRRYCEQAKNTCGKIEYYRDELEFKAFEIAHRTSKPILGICRGLQLINVALGGTLYQDIPSEINTEILHKQSEPKFSFSHDRFGGRAVVPADEKEQALREQLSSSSGKELGCGLGDHGAFGRRYH